MGVATWRHVPVLVAAGAARTSDQPGDRPGAPRGIERQDPPASLPGLPAGRAIENVGGDLGVAGNAGVRRRVF